jgi:hypothetical protein
MPGGCAFRPQPRRKWTEIKTAIVPRSPRYMRLALLTEYIPRAQKFLRAHIAIGEEETRANVLVTFALGEHAGPRVLDFG